MGLIWNVFKYLVLLGARFLFLVSILGFGALLLTEVKARIGDDPRAKLEEYMRDIADLEKQEADARIEEEEAKKELDLELSRRTRANTSAYAQATAAVEARTRDQQSAMNSFSQDLRQLRETEDAFSSGQLKSTFVRVCGKSGVVNEAFCKEWLERAERAEVVAAESGGSEKWHEKLSETLAVKCGVAGFGAITALRSRNKGYFTACTSKKGVASLNEFLNGFLSAISGAETLRQANEALSEASARVRGADEVFDGVAADPKLKEKYDAARNTRESAAAQIVEKKADIARLSADPWVRFTDATDWFWENIVKSYWFAVAAIIAFPYMASWLIYVLAALARHIPAFYARNRTISGRVEKDTAEEVVFSEPLGGASQERASIQAFKGVRQPVVALGKTETLLIRADYVASSRNGTTKVFYSLAYPFTSYAAGLWGLTKFQGSKTQNVVVSASGAEHHDEYIAEIVLDNHPGVVVRPSRVVAVRGDLKLSTRWNFGISSFARFQFRYFTLAGTGAVYLSAPGGVAPRVVNVGDDGEAREHLSHDLILAWDGRLGAGVARNENFIRSALLRDQDLFESSLVGTGVYLQGHSAKDAKLSGATRILNGLFDAILKVFGI